MDKHELIIAITEALDKRRSVTDEIHGEHHAFVALMIAKEERRLARVEKFKNSVIGALAVALVTGLGWVGSLVLEALRHHK